MLVGALQEAGTVSPAPVYAASCPGGPSCIRRIANLLDLIKHSPRARTDVSAQDAGCQAHQTIARLVPLHEGVSNPLGDLGRVGVSNAKADSARPRGETVIQDGKQPGFHLLCAPYPLNWHHLPLRVEREDRLHVEHSGQPRLTPGDPP